MVRHRHYTIAAPNLHGSSSFRSEVNRPSIGLNEYLVNIEPHAFSQEKGVYSRVACYHDFMPHFSRKHSSKFIFILKALSAARKINIFITEITQRMM